MGISAGTPIKIYTRYTNVNAIAPQMLIFPSRSIKRRDESSSRKKHTSRTKLSRSTQATLEPVANTLNMPTTTRDTKKAPPSVLLNPTSPEQKRNERMLANTLSEPFPRDESVRLAIVGDKLSSLDKHSKK